MGQRLSDRALIHLCWIWPFGSVDQRRIWQARCTCTSADHRRLKFLLAGVGFRLCWGHAELHRGPAFTRVSRLLNSRPRRSRAILTMFCWSLFGFQLLQRADDSAVSPTCIVHVSRMVASRDSILGCFRRLISAVELSIFAWCQIDETQELLS